MNGGSDSEEIERAKRKKTKKEMKISNVCILHKAVSVWRSHESYLKKAKMKMQLM
jgi:hypothetical protein